MKWIGLLLVLLLLAGCGTEQTMETVADEVILAVSAQPREIMIELPEEAVLPVLENDNGKLYLCRNYDVEVQTLEGGDLEQTIRTVSGCDMEELTVIQTGQGSFTRHEFVWSAAGEFGEQVCRAAVLDDGYYHYVVSAMILAEKAAQFQEIWNGMFESFDLV